jgi:hypothetical protein
MVKGGNKITRKPRVNACARGLDFVNLFLSAETLPQAHAGIIIIAIIIHFHSLDAQHVFPLREDLLINIIAGEIEKSRKLISTPLLQYSSKHRLEMNINIKQVEILMFRPQTQIKLPDNSQFR